MVIKESVDLLFGIIHDSQPSVKKYNKIDYKVKYMRRKDMSKKEKNFDREEWGHLNS